jgi:hypothetical protein
MSLETYPLAWIHRYPREAEEPGVGVAGAP